MLIILIGWEFVPINLKKNEQCLECRFYRVYCKDCGKTFLNLLTECSVCGEPIRRKCINGKCKGVITRGNCDYFKRRFPEDMKIPRFIE